MEALVPILGRTLIVVAHPDDEAIACGALLQRIAAPAVLFLTDGAPSDANAWGVPAASRLDYARLRRAEAKKALAGLDVRVLHSDIADQVLYLHLDRAAVMLQAAIEQHRPEAILTLAFEGGHPDHDACSLLARLVADENHLRLWEMPLYHRRGPTFVTQHFLTQQGNEVVFPPLKHELVRKQSMVDSYASQHRTLAQFDAEEEVFRPAARYDFGRPPHAGTLNYEAWKWPMSGADIAKEFRKFQSAQRNRKAA